MKHIDKKPEIRKFTKPEAAWLAAAIDGEGSIGLYSYGKEGRRVMIQVPNTDERFCLRAKEIIGCGHMHTRKKQASRLGSKTMYQYGLKGSARCYWVLKQIEPWLIIKQDKAQAIMKELEEKPFGRWANATPEARQAQSERMKATWAKRKQLC